MQTDLDVNLVHGFNANQNVNNSKGSLSELSH